jgi:hypothetical protein
VSHRSDEPPIPTGLEAIKVLVNEAEVRKRINELRERDLIQFLRETVTQLETLADRLSKIVDSPEERRRQ